MIDDWYEVMPCADGITRIRERYIDAGVRCNMWHVRGRTCDVLIDSGFGLRSLVDEVAVLRERPVLAVASHTHFDHVGGHHQFPERLVHPAEAAILASPTDHTTVWAGWEDRRVVVAQPEPDFDQRTWHVRAAPATRLVDEGDVIDLGDRVLEVLHLPGHSPGSIGLYEAATRTLFTGDVIYDGELYDWLYHSDREQYRATLARLKELPGEVFHCGHEESFGRDRLHELVDAYLAGSTR
jgi:glyoxylase-like metal-dependent hydrolase (beta-lactamase superfamily II)